VRQPGPGAEGGQDLIVEKAFQRDVGHRRMRYLVSCKHYAHSRKAVGVEDEGSVLERVRTHKCQGFIGFYSTAASKGILNYFEGLEHDFETQVFDSAEIEKILFQKGNDPSIGPLLRYFPLSGAKLLDKPADSPPPRGKEDGNSQQIEFKRLLEVTLTAMILLKIDRLERRYFHSPPEKIEIGIDKLSGFLEYNNPTLAAKVFSLLSDLSHRIRGEGAEDLAFSIVNAVENWHLGPDDEYPLESETDMAKIGIYIGFNIVYKAMIHVRNLKMAMWGLGLLKFFYLEEVRFGTPGLKEAVRSQYRYLESTLQRPERDDLGLAMLLLKVFENDLDYDDLAHPPLPPELSHLM
jgi:hypothetical protein